MIDAIVYRSNSGFTKEYAEIISRETGVPAYDKKEANIKLKQGASVFYMGWVRATSIVGLKAAMGVYNVIGIAAVGMSFFDEKNFNDTKELHHIESMPVFYLHGGFDKKRLHGVYKFMMNYIGKSIVGQIDLKKEKATEHDLETKEMILNGKSFVSIDNAKEVISFIQERK